MSENNRTRGAPQAATSVALRCQPWRSNQVGQVMSMDDDRIKCVCVCVANLVQVGQQAQRRDGASSIISMLNWKRLDTHWPCNGGVQAKMGLHNSLALIFDLLSFVLSLSSGRRACSWANNDFNSASLADDHDDRHGGTDDTTQQAGARAPPPGSPSMAAAAAASFSLKQTLLSAQQTRGERNRAQRARRAKREA